MDRRVAVAAPDGHGIGVFEISDGHSGSRSSRMMVSDPAGDAFRMRAREGCGIRPRMSDGDGPNTRALTARLVDALYTEAMVLADEARGYFDQHGRAEREALPPLLRVGFSCESLKATTRLMHIIAWLLTRRAVEAGEIGEIDAAAPDRRLGHAAASDAMATAALPEAARAIVAATADLYERVRRIDEGGDRRLPAPSPALGLIRRLERAF